MITKEHLVIGNKVFVTTCIGDYNPTITKVGRKYTYTDSNHIVINNATLRTKDTGYGYGTYAVYESKEQRETLILKAKFIKEVKQKLINMPMSLGLAKRLNHELNLGVDE